MEHLWTDDSENELDHMVEQLALDERFRTWVLNPTPESEAYWTDYQFLNPEKAEVVRQARSLVVALQMPGFPLSAEAVTERADRLLLRIRGHRTADRPVIVRQLNHFGWRWAAAAALILSLGYWGYIELIQRPRLVTAQTQVMRPSLPTEAAGTVTEEFTQSTERQIILPDRSVVTLAPHSYLRYSLPFGKTNRVVALAGQGVFNVQHNPAKPFFVFTDAVVTRVLGTSFTVTNRAGQSARVAVHTGRVSVFHRSSFQADFTSKGTGVILTPNQQATLRSPEDVLTKSLVDKPLPLISIHLDQMDFENRPVAEVIETLVKTYGVPIEYDHNTLSQCKVTVVLEKETLFDQLSLISKLVDGRYEVSEGTIHLYANGCN